MNQAISISRVALRNYKSFARCSVELRPLVFLVGANGSGKSNFLDSLRFVSECLNSSVEHALRERGGINEVRRRSSGHPNHFGIRLELRLPDKRSAHFAFQVGAQQKGGFEVQIEECVVHSLKGSGEDSSYRVESGQVKSITSSVTVPAAKDRLYLVAAAGLQEFRPVYDLLTGMSFYNINPEEIRDLQPPDAGELLQRDGRNLASVLNVLTPKDKTQVVEFLSKVVPGIADVSVKHIHKKAMLEFRQIVGSNSSPWRFMAENMSDGTLRALGILTALFQYSSRPGKTASVVGIEEPESALHPGAAGVLRDALGAASRRTQVLVSSHSPDLLDDKSISDDHILTLESRNGETIISTMDAAGRSAVRDKLYTVGELLRMNQLNPDETELPRNEQLDLFGKVNA